ncbi:uncharacterized protein LOC105174166 [Sesamum indicum]|uniref:Uncharacterized protein LOC105174166 n=1 Tax=Sesamum indicum TaxID=4182 RepID=A0A6I9UJH8_SESIN|nr:uncharacterized protein LOC105174166 [Sesamum indicum]XP_011094474.1 uncharacterized protein LOC105174166 [Sesamum indicum]XP_020553646.1 uncharacterized protein LOC105174166 [Sesamum indicum]
MHAIKGGYVGQAFALATSNDSGGRKSRIRRSKEERKAMVESFIKKYQKSNNGNFPSLNLTHKEVGGSFYTVREIVREIIQENRVLAPPKVSLEKHDHSSFLEQHPLGSLSLEPQIDLSDSERNHMVTNILPNKYQIMSEVDISSSSVQFTGSYPSELDDKQIIEGGSKVAEKDGGSDRTTKNHNEPINYQDTSMEEVSNFREQLPQPKIDEFENEKIVNGIEMSEENPHSDEPLIKYVDCQHNNDSALLSGQEVNGQGSQRIGSEQHHIEHEQTVDKTKEFGQRIYEESAVMEFLDGEKYGAQDVEASHAVKSQMNSDVVVETFPLRPVPRTIHDINGEPDNLHKSTGKIADTVIQDERISYVQSFSDPINENDEEKLSDPIVELNGKFKDEKVVLNLQDSSLECSKHSTASEPSVLDVGDVTDLQSKDSLPDGTKASSSTQPLISEGLSAVGRKSSDQEKSSSPKGPNSTLDRINLETWERASKKSTQPESNPLLALVKAIISSFVKFWTE